MSRERAGRNNRAKSIKQTGYTGGIDMYKDRLDKLRKLMREKTLTQMIVADTPSIFYLTGKWIDSGERLLVLLIREAGNPLLFVNELFPQEETEWIDLVWINDTSDSIGILCGFTDKGKTLGIDKNWPSGFFLKLMGNQGGSDYVNSSLLLDSIRAQKDDAEVAFMREASKRNDEAMQQLIEAIDEDITEMEMEKILGEIYQNLGTDGFSFEPIIAYGKNGADPHHFNGKRLLNEGDSIILDIGCKKDNYCADMTRTVFYRSVSDVAREVYETVLLANETAIAMVRPGVKFKDIDLAARGVIEAKGYGKYFTHRTGHSIGIEVHEYGDVSSSNEDLLKPGMIFSIEPGIYLEGEMGVRIEDLILVSEDGSENLNHYSKELKVVR